MATPAETSRLRDFQSLQATLPDMFARLNENPDLPHTIVVVPSFPITEAARANAPAALHYEERMFYELAHLRRRQCRMVYVTSVELDSRVLDYYLDLLCDVPARHVQERLTLLNCGDASYEALSTKILKRPRLLQRIRERIGDRTLAWLVSLTSNPTERDLALALEIPFHANDPARGHIGTKSGSRVTFREAGVLHPDGFESLRDRDEVVDALCRLKQAKPTLERCVIKTNEGIAGQGNATLGLSACPAAPPEAIGSWIRDNLASMSFEDPTMSPEPFFARLAGEGGVVEEFIEGATRHFPSGQARIAPDGSVEPFATHDQVFSGAGQVFLGCSFPADARYRNEIQAVTKEIGVRLSGKGGRGPYGVDFVVVEGGPTYAIEINLRVTATGIAYDFLHYLTNGCYDEESGTYRSGSGNDKHYFAVDTMQSDKLKGLRPGDLLDMAANNGLEFSPTTGRGVFFHTLGAVSGFGVCGLICIGDSREECDSLYQRLRAAIDQRPAID
ncbi:MAG: peptide ligase PGM1-related protein [Gammaproteobacteria bacterium]|nr:peptide ligase PGM1-related protein [Gammaproteobacteria bacterium]